MTWQTDNNTSWQADANFTAAWDDTSYTWDDSNTSWDQLDRSNWYDESSTNWYTDNNP